MKVAALLKRVLVSMRRVVFGWLDSLACLGSVQQKDTVIILRLDALGDFFIWLRSGAVATTEFAHGVGGEVILIANQAWGDYARRLGLWDQVLLVEPKKLMRNILYRFNILRSIRALGAKLLIQPRSARVYLQEDSIARICGAALKIGNAGILRNLSVAEQRRGNGRYQRLIAVDPRLSTHEMVRNGEFSQTLTGKSVIPYDFRHWQGLSRARRIVFAIGAAWVGRMWPTDKLVALIRYVGLAYPIWEIVLVGGKQERQRAETIDRQANVPLRNLAGSTDVQQLVQLIAESSVVVCNESAAYHIAASMGRQVIAFVGGGHFGSFAPYPRPFDTEQNVLTVPMDCFGFEWKCKFPRGASGAVKCVEMIELGTATRAIDVAIARVEQGVAASG